MNTDHTTLDLHGFKCIIGWDEDPQDPDSGDSEFVLGLTETRRCRVGRTGWNQSQAHCHIPFGEGPWDFTGPCDLAVNRDYVDSVEELREQWADQYDPSYLVFPVELCDHGSGTTLRRCDYRDANGYIFIKVPWASELERLVYPDFNPEAPVAGLLEDWNTYLRGDVHWARIEDSEGEMLDSCCGFYGESAAEAWCKEAADSLRDQLESRSVWVIRGSTDTPEVEFRTLEVPLGVGKDHTQQWAMTEGPLAGDDSILQVVLYSEREKRKELAAK